MTPSRLPLAFLILLGLAWPLTSRPALAFPDGPGDVCYLVADNDGNNDSQDVFTEVDKNTSLERVIGATGTLHMEAIAFSPFATVLYAVHQDGNVGRFGTIDLNTGLFTEIGEVGSGDGALGTKTFADLDGLAFHPITGQLFATVRKPDEDLLIRIDPTTGKAVADAFGPGVDYLPVEPMFGLDDIDDIAIDPADGLLYAILNEEGMQSRLITIDPATGATTDVTDIDVDNVEGMTFDTDGTLLGVLGDSGARVVFIDRQNGTTTPRADLGTGGNIDYESIACLTHTPNTILGTVFEDVNASGTFDGGDTGTPGITVELYRDVNANGQVDGGDLLLDTRPSGSGGAYAFEVAAEGHFVLQLDTATLPPGALMTTDNVETAHFTGFGQTDAGNDFGYRLPASDASIGDLVFEDASGNGVFDGGEAGIAGVTLRLYAGACPPAGGALASTETDGDGIYAFTGLPAGTYCVNVDEASLPDDATLTTGNEPLTVTLAESQHVTDADFGYRLPAAMADLRLDKTVNNPTPDAGSTVVFTVTLTNDGPLRATNITVRDVLPYGLNFVGAVASVGAYDAPSGRWQLAALDAGQAATLVITADVDPVVTGFEVVNVAEVIAVDQEDPDSTPANGILSEDDQDDARIMVGGGGPPHGLADLSLTKTVDQPAPPLGGIVTFTITVHNDGPDDATHVVVRDVIGPAGVLFVAAATSQGTYDDATGFWTLGTLPVGASATLNLQVQIQIINMIENIAQVIAVDQEDPDSTPGNGIPAEDDQDRALVEARGPIGGGGILRPECADAGTINALLFDPATGRLLAGTEEGMVHVSTDDGENWPPFLTTDGHAPVRDLLATPSGTLFAATFGDGVYRSDDGGDSWTGLGPAGAKAQALAFDAGTGTLFAALEGQVAAWDGVTWTVVGAGTNPFATRQVLAVVYDPATGSLLAASPDVGVFRFDGLAWLGAGTGLPTGRLNDLTLGPAGQVLAAHNNDGVYAFDGAAWSRFGTGLERRPVETVVTGVTGALMAGTREDGFFLYDAATGTFLSRSIDNLAVYTIRSATVNADGVFFVGAPGEGIFRSEDTDADGLPDRWHQVSSFLANAVIQGLVVTPEGHLFAATYGYGVLFSDNGGQCWTRVNRGLVNLWTFAITRRSDGTLFIGIWADGKGGVWASTDGGRNWTFLGLGRRQIVSLAIDPNNEDVLFAGANLTGEGSIFRSDDGGQTWGQLPTFTLPAWALAVDPARAHTLVVGTHGDGVWRTTDSGQTFEQIGSVATGLTSEQVFELKYAPTGTPYAGTLFAGTADGVFRYDESTGLWSRFGAGSEGHEIRTLEFSGATIFAGSFDDGVLEYDPATDTWNNFGLGGMPVVAFAVDRTTETLLIGTEGHGVFLAPRAATATAVEEAGTRAVPQGYALSQNYPNPFNPSTRFDLSLPETAPVRVTVYDLLGRAVRVLVDRVLPAGTHQLTFEAGDLPSGTYLYRLETPRGAWTRTMMLVK